MVKILDCTIRDGGHLNGWTFTKECVKASYYAAIKAGVDFFEIGYRFENPKPEWGDFARCDDDFLLSFIEKNEKCKISVMIDAGKCSLDKFKECKPELTPIEIVRVATYPQKLDVAFSLAEGLKKKGYRVFINFMAISEYKEEHFEKIKAWQNKDILEGACFADSFGAFIPDTVAYFYKKLKSLGFENICYHSHNNLQLAFANSLRAIEEGFYCIDASIYGMGRGSGNLPAEIITGYLSKIGNDKYNPVAYIDVIERFYLELSKQTPWGYRIQSLIGGLKNIHPYYVNGLFEKRCFTINEIWTAAGLIKKYAPISFNTDEMNAVLSDKFVNYDDISIKDKIQILPEQDAFEQGNVEFKNKHKGRNFLIIANGSSITEEREKIEYFIKDKNCITIGTNFLNKLYKPDYHCFINRKRFLKYISTVDESSVLLLPSYFGKEIIYENTKNKVMYFDAELRENTTELFTGDKHNYKYLNVAISAIYLAYQMGAKEIFASGIDGFGKNGDKLEYFYKEDDVFEEKNELMKAYEEFCESLDIVSKFLEKKSIPFSIITKTSHDKYYSEVVEYVK